MLLFAHHTAVMDALAFGLTVDKVSFVRIDGSVSHNARTAAVAAFQSSSDSSPRVALLSIHAAGVGITLTAASRVVFGASVCPFDAASLGFIFGLGPTHFPWALSFRFLTFPPRPAELAWTPGLLRQAEDRAHRHGQKLPVNVYFLCARGTSDDRRRVIAQRTSSQRAVRFEPRL